MSSNDEHAAICSRIGLLAEPQHTCCRVACRKDKSWLVSGSCSPGGCPDMVILCTVAVKPTVLIACKPDSWISEYGVRKVWLFSYKIGVSGAGGVLEHEGQLVYPSPVTRT